MPSPSHHQGTGKGFKSSDPLRQFHFNQQRPGRSFNQQSPMVQYDGQDYGYGNQRRNYRQQHQQQQQQQDYYNLNRRNQNYGYAEWPRQSQRYARPMQNYDNNRFYPSRRKSLAGNDDDRSKSSSLQVNQTTDLSLVLVNDAIRPVVSPITNNRHATNVNSSSSSNNNKVIVAMPHATAVLPVRR